MDVTKIHANASRHSALSYAHAEKIESKIKAEVAELLKLAEEPTSIPQRMDLPEEIQRREDRLAAIAAAKEKIEARAQELPKDIVRPQQLLADIGYYSENNVEACETTKIDPMIAKKCEQYHTP